MTVVQEQRDAIVDALARTDDRLAFLARIPQADTAAAQRAVDGLRLEILDEFHGDVARALGVAGSAPRVAAAPEGGEAA